MAKASAETIFNVIFSTLSSLHKKIFSFIMKCNKYCEVYPQIFSKHTLSSSLHSSLVSDVKDRKGVVTNGCSTLPNLLRSKFACAVCFRLCSNFIWICLIYLSWVMIIFAAC